MAKPPVNVTEIYCPVKPVGQTYCELSLTKSKMNFKKKYLFAFFLPKRNIFNFTYLDRSVERVSLLTSRLKGDCAAFFIALITADTKEEPFCGDGVLSS